jgi:hypothetical protein
VVSYGKQRLKTGSFSFFITIRNALGIHITNKSSVDFFTSLSSHDLVKYSLVSNSCGYMPRRNRWNGKQQENVFQ